MQIWVDADACPQAIREILFRAADRLHVPLVLVANKLLRLPASAFIRFIRVAAGPDVADKEIVRQLEKGDLVITADIPLAANVVAKGGFALDPRGTLYSNETIGERLSMRNFMDELRGSGVETGGPAPLAKCDRQAFANQLDRFLARAMASR
ncbi:MAG: YaiI/YqxD family protein [Deltaproteobacteria bacterium]